MQVKPSDKLFQNNSKSVVLVTYEIQCPAGESPFVLEMVEADGYAHPACRVGAGKTEQHCFAVSPGGELRCASGSGQCIWKGTARDAWHRRAWPLAAGFFHRARAFRQAVPEPVKQRLLLLIYAIGIVWLNAYVVRNLFFVEYTGKVNSIQGIWIAMARMGSGHWFKPSWWPYWYNGMPFEFTYAPLVPMLTALSAWITGFSAARGLQMVNAMVYCLSPLALFLMAREVTRRAGWSFVAAVVYSLTSASALLLPDDPWAFSVMRRPRRLYLSLVWDELPHQLGLTMACLAVFFLARAIQNRDRRSYIWAGICVALSLLGSAFGATGLVLLVGCLLVTCETRNFWRNVAGVACCGLLGYLAMCPFLPPSLMQAIRADASLFPHMRFTESSVWTLLAVMAVFALLWFLSRNWRPWYIRFFLLFAYLTFIIPFVYQKWGYHFFPQASRYLVELELGLTLLVVFGMALVVDRLPKVLRVVLAMACLYPAYLQTREHRIYAKNDAKSVDITKYIEYKTAKWIDGNLPGWRVQAPGSIWPLLNVFGNNPQFEGGSFPTEPSKFHLRVESEIGSNRTKLDLNVLWFQAYGVDALVVPGKKSPEYWQPHDWADLYDGLLPVIWDEEDTKIYQVPRVLRSLAHVVPEAAVVTKEPATMADNGQVRAYMAALDDAGAAPASFSWLDDNHARIHANVGTGQVVSVQVTYHPGWKASSGGREVPVSKDALDDMVLKPGAGEADISLEYDGGFESKLCRAVSVMVLLGGLVLVFWKKLLAD
jgi:hypothetical protein